MGFNFGVIFLIGLVSSSVGQDTADNKSETPTNCSPLQILTDDLHCKAEGSFPIKDNCTHYYVCVETASGADLEKPYQLAIAPCPTDLHFNGSQCIPRNSSEECPETDCIGLNGADFKSIPGLLSPIQDSQAETTRPENVSTEIFLDDRITETEITIHAADDEHMSEDEADVDIFVGVNVINHENNHTLEKSGAYKYGLKPTPDPNEYPQFPGSVYPEYPKPVPVPPVYHGDQPRQPEHHPEPEHGDQQPKNAPLDENHEDHGQGGHQAHDSASGYLSHVSISVFYMLCLVLLFV